MEKKENRGGRRMGAGRPPTGRGGVVRSFYIPKDVSEKLDTVARQTGLGISDITTQLIKLGFKSFENS